jgi:hypothetical protein
MALGALGTPPKGTRYTERGYQMAAPLVVLVFLVERELHQ